MAIIERNGKKIISVAVQFTPATWKKMQKTRRAIEKKVGHKISDSAFVRYVCMERSNISTKNASFRTFTPR